jgi:3-oxoacyl-[acyl-carrier protein] reductase
MTNTNDLGDMTGKVVLVTGAGQGVGRGIARMMAAHGAEGVIVNDYVLEKAQTVAAEIEKEGGRALAVQADVSNIEQVRAAVAAGIGAFGHIDVLVNNAGNAGPDGFGTEWPLFWESDPASWNRFFNVNLYGVMNCCHAVMPGMVERQYGRIITIVSDAGRLGEARMAEYSAAKAGAAGFSRGLARDAGRYGITVNNLALGTMELPLPEDELQQWLASDRTKAQLSRYVIRRFGRPDDIASMCLFLASDAASWITGQTYPVNGGYSFGQ